jgi:Flp pilus assembly protein TadG
VQTNKKQNRNRSGFRTGATQKSRRGVAIIEFALTIPILGVLSVAVFDFAKLGYIRLVVADAAGAASRYAAFHPVTDLSTDSWVDGIKQSALASVAGSVWVDPNRMSLHTADVEQITPTLTRITIRVDYQYQPTFWWPGLPTGTRISAQVAIPGVR